MKLLYCLSVAPLVVACIARGLLPLRMGRIIDQRCARLVPRSALTAMNAWDAGNPRICGIGQGIASHLLQITSRRGLRDAAMRAAAPHNCGGGAGAGDAAGGGLTARRCNDAETAARCCPRPTSSSAPTPLLPSLPTGSPLKRRRPPTGLFSTLGTAADAAGAPAAASASEQSPQSSAVTSSIAAARASRLSRSACCCLSCCEYRATYAGSGVPCAA